MIVRVMTSSGGLLGEISSREEFLELVQSNTPLGYIPEFSSPEGVRPIDIDGALFEGDGAREVAVDYVPLEQYLRRLRPEVVDDIDRVVHGVRKTVLTLRAGGALGDTVFVPLLEGISWIGRASELAATLIAQVSSAPSASVKGFGSPDGLAPVLERLHRAVRDEDFLEVADILEEEITDWLEARRSQWGSLAGDPL